MKINLKKKHMLFFLRWLAKYVGPWEYKVDQWFVNRVDPLPKPKQYQAGVGAGVDGDNEAQRKKIYIEYIAPSLLYKMISFLLVMTS